MDVLEWPPGVGTPLGLDDADRLGDALVWPDPGVAQVVQRAQDVVVIPGGE